MKKIKASKEFWLTSDRSNSIEFYLLSQKPKWNKERDWWKGNILKHFCKVRFLRLFPKFRSRKPYCRKVKITIETID